MGLQSISAETDRAPGEGFQRRPSLPASLRGHGLHRGRRLGGARNDPPDAPGATLEASVDAHQAAQGGVRPRSLESVRLLTDRELEVLRLMAAGLSNGA